MKAKYSTDVEETLEEKLGTKWESKCGAIGKEKLEAKKEAQLEAKEEAKLGIVFKILPCDKKLHCMLLSKSIVPKMIK